MLHVRHALVNKSVPSSAKQQHEITAFTVYASVNSSCTLPSLPLCQPRGPKNLSTFLKVCSLDFNMYFNLKGHNFKVNSESVYKLSRFATARI